jgi:hypothetical protein
MPSQESEMPAPALPQSSWQPISCIRCGRAGFRIPWETNVDQPKQAIESEQQYLRAVLNAYVELPETPERWHSADREIVRELFRRGIPVDVVQTAFVLGSARRLGRDPQKQVPRIRCVGYFLQVIEEVLVLPPPPRYIEYLRWAMPRLAARAGLTTKT